MKRLFRRHGPPMLLLSALAIAGLFMGRQLSAGQADSPSPTPYLTEFGFAPAVFGDQFGPTYTPPPPVPTKTPWATATTDPAHTPTTTPTSTATSIAGTPTATATATMIPEVLPTVEAGAVSVLDNHQLWVDDSGRLQIRGEVENTGAEHLYGVQITTEFRNKKGRILHREQAMTVLNHLAPGEKTCFALSLDPPDRWRSYTFGEISYKVDPQPIDGLELDSVSGGLDEFMGWYALSGQVINRSSHSYDLLRLVGTVYDAAGTVVGCDFGYTFDGELEPGQAGSFEILFADREYADAAGFQIQAEGERR